MSPQVPHPDLLQGRAHVQQGKEEQQQEEEEDEEGEGLVVVVEGRPPAVQLFLLLVVPFCRHLVYVRRPCLSLHPLCVCCNDWCVLRWMRLDPSSSRTSPSSLLHGSIPSLLPTSSTLATISSASSTPSSH